MLVLRWPLDHLGWSAAVVAGILVVVAFALAWMITHRVDVDVVTAQPAGSHDFLVPAAAVQNQGGSDVVFVVVSNTAYRQPVLVVNSGATDTIASGLSKGAVVVVDSVSALKDGQTVHISNG
jgi:UDP-N-acetyl-D-mannosaminuronate dehydrogenase